MRFPNTFSTLLMAAASPTTVNLSPNCSTSPGVANNCTPARYIRVILIPYNFRNFNCPRRLPFNSGFVIRIRRLINWLSIRIHCLRSISISSPIKVLIVSASVSVVITKTLSFSCNTVLAEAISICLLLSRQTREITKSRCSSRFDNSATVLLKIAGFFTINEIGLASLV